MTHALFATFHIVLISLFWKTLSTGIVMYKIDMNLHFPTLLLYYSRIFLRQTIAKTQKHATSTIKDV